MTTYEESAYPAKRIREAVASSKYPSFKRCISELSAAGYSLAEVAAELGLDPQRFRAFYILWCKKNAQPLRLGE